MIKIIELEEDIKSIKEALVKAKEVLEESNLIFDRFFKNYIYLNGPTVGDLVVFEYSKKKSKFISRKCTDDEWNEFYKVNILPNNKKK